MAPNSISAYTTSFNCIRMNYPFKLCIESLFGFADEVIVVDAGSDDGTIEELEKWSKREARLKFFVEPVDYSHPRWAVHMDGYLKAKSRAHCSGDYCWQTDNDEVVVPHDFERIRMLPGAIGQFLIEKPILFLPMVEFWGRLDRMRADFLSWKPRFSTNDKRITHGIPLEFRMVDWQGYEYPRPFESDSCNYIWADTKESVPMLLPITVTNLDMQPEEFDTFFTESLQRLPSVLHISWLDLRRKIQHYRSFWPKFHASMYNLDDPDLPQNNTMFSKRWSEVSDQDIEDKARELDELGPRFFSQGKKMDSKARGATVPYRGVVPESLREWIRNTLGGK